MAMSLEEWAARWMLPPQALAELAQTVIFQPDDEVRPPKSEAYVQSQVRLEAPHAGVYLFRNNNGAGKLDSGNFVRFGLGNDSPQLSKVLKSGDLIGIRKRLITTQDVGYHIGQMVSREIKRTDWTYRGTPEENAQLRWATLINSQGGDAKIVTGPGSFLT